MNNEADSSIRFDQAPGTWVELTEVVYFPAKGFALAKALMRVADIKAVTDCEHPKVYTQNIKGIPLTQKMHKTEVNWNGKLIYIYETYPYVCGLIGGYAGQDIKKKFTEYKNWLREKEELEGKGNG